MINSTAARAWWPAVGAPLERGVRPQLRHGRSVAWQWQWPGFLGPERETASLLPAEVRDDAHATTSAVAGASAAATRLPNKLTLRKLAGASWLEPAHEAPVKDENHRSTLDQRALRPVWRREGVGVLLASGKRHVTRGGTRRAWRAGPGRSLRSNVRAKRATTAGRQGPD